MYPKSLSHAQSEFSGSVWSSPSSAHCRLSRSVSLVQIVKPIRDSVISTLRPVALLCDALVSLASLFLHWKITSPSMCRHLQISLPLHILALLVSSFQSIQERTGSDEFEALCGEKKLPMQCEAWPSIGRCLDVSCKTRTSTACTVARCPVFVTCEFLVLASGISFYVIRAFALGFVERSKCLTVRTSLALDTLSHETLPSPVPSLLRSTRNCRPALSLGLGARQRHLQVMRSLCIVSSAVRIVFLERLSHASSHLRHVFGLVFATFLSNRTSLLNLRAAETEHAH